MGITAMFRKWAGALRGPHIVPKTHVAQDGLTFPPQPVPLAVTKAAVDAYVADLSARITAAGPAPVRSIMISGTERCGKTLLAREICSRTGMVHLPSDRIRNATYLHSTGAERARLVKYIYKRLLLLHPTGLVLEGTVFMDHGVTLAPWAKARHIHVFAVGYAQNDAARKARHMIRYRRTNSCWTTGVRSDDDIRRMARRIVSRSRDIRSYCDAHGLVYLDLDSGRFHMELRRLRRAILRKMGVRPKRDQGRVDPVA